MDDRDAVTLALAALTPHVRACVMLRYYDDLTVAQIAGRLGHATGTFSPSQNIVFDRLVG